MSKEIEQDLNTKQLEGHYKKHMDRTYLGSYDLMKDDGTFATVKIKIDGVYSRMIYNLNKRKHKKCTIASIEGKEKDFIINVENQDRIVAISGTELVQEWVGLTMMLGVEKVKVGGGTKNGLRVKPVGNK